MIHVFCEKLYMQLEDEIEQIAITKPTPLKRLTASLNCIRKSLMELKDYIIQNPLVDQQEEIHFFKQIKPKFYCLQIFEIEVYNINSAIPSGTEDDILAYYLGELKIVQRFFNQNQFHYHYYRMDAEELDKLYFVRGTENQSVLIPVVPDLDPTFSTNCDYIFSKIRAYEMLRDYLLAIVGKSGLENDGKYLRHGRKRDPLNWTGDTINLVELAYGIYVTDQLNGGKVSLADIVYWLETSLHVDLSRYYRRFEDIKRRKSKSKTFYLDHMRTSIHQRIDDGNAHVPTNTRKI